MSLLTWILIGFFVSIVVVGVLVGRALRTPTDDPITYGKEHLENENDAGADDYR